VKKMSLINWSRLAQKQNLWEQNGRPALWLLLLISLLLALLPLNGATGAAPTGAATAEIAPITFDDRLSCQTSIEAVYWQRRI
jgi:hypothetical protein